MTTNSKAKIQIQSRRGRIHPRVRHGWFDVDGGTAVTLIAIIVAARVSRVIFRRGFRFLVWLIPVIVRASVIMVRLVGWLAREIHALYYLH